MRQELSSRASFIHRIVLPIALTSGSVIMLWQLGSNPAVGFDDLQRATIEIIFLGAASAYAWYLSRAKRVWLEDDELIVRGFSEEFRIPLRSIDRVTATRFRNPEQVRIYFGSPMGEESSIFFVPPFRWIRFWSQHPIAEEIRELVRNEDSSNTPYISNLEPTDWKVVVMVTIGVATLAVVLIGGINLMMRNSEPYQWSLAQAQNDPFVVDRLGSPIEPGWFITGSISTGNDRGSALLRYSVAGPNGEGDVVIEGESENGVWIYERAGVRIGDDYANFLEN